VVAGRPGFLEEYVNSKALTRGAPNRMARRLPLLITLAVLGALLGACVPTANVLSVPTFSLDASQSGFVRIDPPGVGEGAALFRLALEVKNPNAIGVKLAGLDGALFLRNARAATATFRGGIDVPAGGSAPLILDVKVPLGAAPALLDTIATYISGAATPFRLDAAVTIDVFGAPQRFPEFTLVRGELPAPSGLQAPQLQLLGGSVRFESVSSVAVSLDLRLANPGLIGFRVGAPELRLAVAGADAATGSLGAVELPAGASSDVSLTFRFNPLALGAALAAQVQAASTGGAGLAVSMSGGWNLEAPGIATLVLQPTSLLDGVLR
jgi:hypothetical protein